MAQPEPSEDQRYLAKHEAEYLRAKEYVKSDQYASDVMGLVIKMRKIVTPRSDWTGDRALFAIGGVDYVLSEFAAKTAIIAEYESKQESVRRATRR